MEQNLNLKLRSYILECTLPLEKLTSMIIKELLRISSNNTKTLDNKSSNLAFKQKVDLFHDLGIIDKELYLDLINIMQIRNQFMHNYECNSFLYFKKLNSDYLKRIKKYTNSINNEEESLEKSYNDLINNSLKFLNNLHDEYKLGVQIEISNHIDHLAFQNFNTIAAKVETKLLSSYSGKSLVEERNRLRTYLQCIIEEMYIFANTKQQELFSDKKFTQLFDKKANKEMMENKYIKNIDYALSKYTNTEQLERTYEVYRSIAISFRLNKLLDKLESVPRRA